jgi:pyruvate-formate lyase-activating enzyme
VIVTIQPQSHVNGSGEKSTVVNVQGGVSSWNCRGCANLKYPEKHPRLRHFRASGEVNEERNNLRDNRIGFLHFDNCVYNLYLLYC